MNRGVRPRRRPNVLPDIAAQNPMVAALSDQMPAAIVDATIAADGLVLHAASKYVEAVCRYLKQQARFERLSAVTGVDWWPREPRFEVIYFLHSLSRNERLR